MSRYLPVDVPVFVLGIRCILYVIILMLKREPKEQVC